MFVHGLQKQALAASSRRSASARQTPLPRSCAVRKERAGHRCPSRLSGGRFPRLAMVQLESNRCQPERAQRFSRSCDWEADRTRARVAAASDPPSRRAAAVLTEAPEWATFSNGGKTGGGGKRGSPRRAGARKIESCGAGANDAPTQMPEAAPGISDIGPSQCFHLAILLTGHGSPCLAESPAHWR